MCKYILINPQTITNIAAIYVYYVRYNQKPLFPVTFKPHFPKKNPAKQALSIFCNNPQNALHPCCNFFVFLWPHTCQEMLALFVIAYFNVMIELARL